MSRTRDLIKENVGRCIECGAAHNPWGHHASETVWRAQERHAIAAMLRERAAVCFKLAQQWDADEPEQLPIHEAGNELVRAAEELEKPRKARTVRSGEDKP